MSFQLKKYLLASVGFRCPFFCYLVFRGCVIHRPELALSCLPQYDNLLSRAAGNFLSSNLSLSWKVQSLSRVHLRSNPPCIITPWLTDLKLYLHIISALSFKVNDTRVKSIIFIILPTFRKERWYRTCTQVSENLGEAVSQFYLLYIPCLQIESRVHQQF